MPDSGRCGNGQTPNPGDKQTLQAFSDPNPDGSKYSRITFCNDFFQLHDLSVAVENGKKSGRKTNLSIYDNTARVMFHEITHLDYFMNAPKTSPYVSDLEIEYRDKGQVGWHGAYGPFNARLLTKWQDTDPAYSGYFTQRNADNYAWFAMAKYVEGQIGEYPRQPKPGPRKVQSEPRDARTHIEPEGHQSVDLGDDDSGDDDADILDYPVPGCGDKLGVPIPNDVISASIISEHAQATAS